MKCWADSVSVSQGALAERQQLIPELVRNGDEENPLKVRKLTQYFKDLSVGSVSVSF